MNAIWLNSQQWHNRLKSIETRNMKQYKRSYTVPTIERNLHDCIIEYDIDGSIHIDYDKYNELRKTAGVMPTEYETMIDRNGNAIQSGETVDIIQDSALQYKAIFHSCTDTLATIQELGVKFQRGGLQGYSIQVLRQYVYKQV